MMISDSGLLFGPPCTLLNFSRFMALIHPNT